MADQYFSLTQARLKELFHYSKETGIFTRARPVGGRWLVGEIVGSANSSGYMQIRVDGGRYLAHRLAFLYTQGHWPTGEVDHIDGNRANNSFHNLRDVTHSVNMQNQRTSQRRTKSKLIGAHYQLRSNRWLSQIVLDGKLKHIGSFDTAKQAHEAYLNEKRQSHEGCTI